MTRLHIGVLGVALAGCIASAAWAQEPPTGLTTRELRGKVGPYLVGVNVTLRDYVQFVVGHYFYARRPTDIPLAGQIQGASVTLEEPGGGVFRLHLVSRDPMSLPPLTFYNSTGLRGAWTQGNRTLPVTLDFDYEFDGPSPTRWYSDIAEPDAVFEARVRRFIRGAIDGDKAAVAGAVSYPLRVYFARRRLTVRTKGELLAHWNEIFTPKLLAKLRKAVPHEMFTHEGQAMIGLGEVWFDAKGAVAINAP